MDFISFSPKQFVQKTLKRFETSRERDLGQIADYLVDSLTEQELALLWKFIQNGQPANDLQSLVDLRLAEPSEDNSNLKLTQLGRDVASRTTPQNS